jgi:ketosteroid isomerase-like protein
MNTIEAATKKLLLHHLTAFGNNNIDEIMIDYSEQSIIFCDKGAIKGMEKIRQFLEEMFRLILAGSEFEMKQLTISQQWAHIIWISKSVTAEIP